MRRPVGSPRDRRADTTHDLICIPHGHSMPVNATLTALQSPIHRPYQEYLVKWNAVHQHRFEQPLEPEGGVIRLPEIPGLCPALDESKVEASAEL